MERSESWGDLGLFPGEGQAGTNLGENPCSCVGRRDRERKLWVVCLSREGLRECRGAPIMGENSGIFPCPLAASHVAEIAILLERSELGGRDGGIKG